jgi:hypothetical protein
MAKAGGAPIKTLRTMSVAVLLTPVVLGLVVLLAARGGDYPPPYLPLVLGAVAIGGVRLAETVGYTPRPIEPGTPKSEAARVALREYHGRWFVRSVSTQVVLLFGLLLSFMLTTSWPYLVAFALGWPIMIFEVWPWRRSVAKVKVALEWAGANSYLEDALYGDRSRAET